MKAVNTDIAQQLMKIVGIDKIPMAVMGKVVSIDDDEMTCEVEPISGSSNFKDVRIMADNNTSGFLLKPAIDSIVIIAPQSENIYYIALVGEVSEIWLKGEQYGGLVKVGDLVTRMNLIESRCNDILTTLKNTTIPLAPSGTYPFAPLYASLSNLTETVESDIENEDVKHG